jgi:hypothetical protein
MRLTVGGWATAGVRGIRLNRQAAKSAKKSPRAFFAVRQQAESNMDFSCDRLVFLRA